MADRVAITFIRHGATVNNEKQVYQGWLDAPLLEREKARIQAMKSQFPKPQKVFSSDLVRSLDTARLLFPEHEIETTMLLRELHFGDFEGKAYEQLKHNQAYQKWMESEFQIPPPNGESFQKFAMRLQTFWERLSQEFSPHISEIAIVTHSGVIRHFLVHFAPIEKSFWEWRVPLAGGYRLVTTKERLRRKERCISFSEVPLTEKQNG